MVALVTFATPCHSSSRSHVRKIDKAEPDRDCLLFFAWCFPQGAFLLPFLPYFLPADLCPFGVAVQAAWPSQGTKYLLEIIPYPSDEAPPGCAMFCLRLTEREAPIPWIWPELKYLHPRGGFKKVVTQFQYTQYTKSSEKWPEVMVPWSLGPSFGGHGGPGRWRPICRTHCRTTTWMLCWGHGEAQLQLVGFNSGWISWPGHPAFSCFVLAYNRLMDFWWIYCDLYNWVGL